ncbi:MAG: hypothetical protein N2489_09265 [Clostridia bacterium]|nr:hypothetical protein [Clostridia bacterium]
MTVAKDKQNLQNIRKLKKLLRLIPEDRKAIGEKLVEEISFMSETLMELKKTVSEKGVVDLFEQGKQKFMRESPALKAYNTTIQRYSLLYRQLTDLLPKPEPSDKAKDELLEHLQGKG